MKFLVLSKPCVGVPLPDNPEIRLALFQATKQFVENMLADGRVDCAYNFVSGQGGVTIANADSHEQLFGRIAAYPLYPFYDWEVQPIVDHPYVLGRLIGGIQKTGGG